MQIQKKSRRRQRKTARRSLLRHGTTKPQHREKTSWYIVRSCKAGPPRTSDPLLQREPRDDNTAITPPDEWSD